MLKSGGAVILMQQNFNIKVLFGNKDFNNMKKLPSKPVFSQEICDFLDNLSSAIMKSPLARKYPDIITFGFFCRKSNIKKLRDEYFETLRIGRGLSFHIAPSNVPINFAYSLVFSLLAGNSCVVRVSSKDFEQTRIICDIMKTLDDREIKNYISILQYERNSDINDYFSSLSDVRIIWGGDNTIDEIKKSKTPSRCVDITFADRYSICVLNAEYVNKIENIKKMANDFYNDTYLYDQNACSSPRLMYWIGTKDEIAAAKKVFWEGIHNFIKDKYQVEPVIAVNKMITSYSMAIDKCGVLIEHTADNLINRIQLNELDFDVTQYACPGGIYLEYNSETLDDLKKIVNKKFQTMAYLGGNVKEYSDFVVKNGFSGIDRIVPIGKTSDISLTWDGYNLIETMSRKVYVE